MFKQMKLLTKVELCNLYGWNVFRHTKDRKAKKKSMAMAAVFGLVFVILMGYVCGLCYGLAMLGAGSIIPTYLIGISSIIILMFSIFKIGGVIFRKQGYDMLTAMPLSKWAVVISRFLRLYVENLLVVLPVMVPGMVMYGIFVCPGAVFYIIGILATLIIPLPPVAVASFIGALITGIASRMKHKALVEAGLSILFLVVCMWGTAKIPTNEEELTAELFYNITEIVTEAMGSLYPPAIWLGNAMVQEQWGVLGAVAGGFSLLFLLVIALVAMNFHGICRRLYATSAKHNYQMEHLKSTSVRKALIIRESRRYFASGIYVSNTIIGPIMAVTLSIGLLFVDLDNLTVSAPITLQVRAAVPFAIGAVFAMMNTTSVSISMEGKEVWIAKSLPLSRKVILDSKLLFNLYLFAPFYVVSAMLCSIALKPNVPEFLGVIFIPAIILLFSAVFGISANLWFPKLEWENEVAVVKQSTSAVIGGLGGALLAVVSTMVVLLVPAAYTDIVCVVICILFVAATVILYRRNNQGSEE